MRCPRSQRPATSIKALGRADGTTVIGLQSHWTWVALFAFWAANVALAIASGCVTEPIIYAGAVGVMGALLCVLNAAEGDRLPRWAAMLMIVGVPVMTVLGIAGVDSHSPGMAYYFIMQGASVIFGFGCLRGRIGAALIGFALCTVAVVVTALWGWLEREQLLRGYVNALAVMVIGVVFTMTVGRAAARIYQLRVRTLAEVSAHAAQTAVRAERDAQLARLDNLARPMLNLIAAGELTDSDALRAMLIEGQLRDQMRAPALDDPRVADAVAWARARGVQVTLLDDSRPNEVDQAPVDDAWHRVLERVRGAAVAELAAASDGMSVTVRVGPRDREVIATMLVSDGEQIRHREFRAG